MLYIDYIWDLTPTTIRLDSELDTDQLMWNEGDFWIMENYNGKKILRKVDKLEKFVNQQGEYSNE